MNVGALNLARQPFLNRRPVWRFALVAWVVGLALVTTNLLFWVGYRRDSTDSRARLAGVRQEIEAVSSDVVTLSGRLDELGLEAQNEQIEFLNERLAERTFPWSALFERVGGILPPGVRLVSLSPAFASARRSAENEGRLETVRLSFNCVARHDDDLYEFVQGLFDSPAFEDPKLHGEDYGADGLTAFRLDVLYHPGALSEQGATSDADPQSAAGTGGVG